ncbi:phage gp6-like head-tail connector protein [Cohnella xylanilytica]|uniref:Phage gp6-like head-tail connector protein n=1 Tax=Cohnella xylanilytica TaxID=557555 RepID=A0A841TZE3_9BACL|nr:head-tail connector protein [Cohnella xylanilytica]MBB6692328.1 phage gp6-like head-tail connector protein [Cohnella xylanilytica]
MLITLKEGREALRLDGTDNDNIIQALIDSIPSYLEVSTGRSWDTEPVHPLAQTIAKFILQLWYYEQGPDTERLKRTIDSLLVGLTAIGRTLE